MDDGQAQIRKSLEALAREEKRFLMDHYAALLMRQIEAFGDQEPDERVVESLRIARNYASPERIEQIDRTISSAASGSPEVSLATTEKRAEKAAEPPVEDEFDLDELFGEEEAEPKTTETPPAGEQPQQENEEIPAPDKRQPEDQEIENLFQEEDQPDAEQPQQENEETPAPDKRQPENQEIENLFQEEDQPDAEQPQQENAVSNSQKTAGFTPAEGHENRETPGFTPVQGHENREESTDDNPAEQQRESLVNPDHTAGQSSHLSLEAALQNKQQDDAERAIKARKEMEKRRQERKAELDSKETANSAIEISELLQAMAFSVSLDELERRMEIQVSSEDRLKLDRRLTQKLREASVKLLLNEIRETGQSYALIPRLPIFYKDKNPIRVTIANLMRNFPDLFEHAEQIILQYRLESFFIEQTPSLDWAIVSCEALPESQNKTYAQQQQILKQYAQRMQAHELRVRRRSLVEALYDLAIVRLVCQETMLNKTVELTDSKIDRQNLTFINYGNHGIRINDTDRQQAHPQLGFCPSW